MEEKEIFDSMRNLEQSPEDYINLMFERTDEDGILYAPALFYCNAGWGYGVPETYEDESYRCKMNWNLFKYEKTLNNFKRHLDFIQRIGAILHQARKNEDKPILRGELLEFWKKFLAPHNVDGFDENKISDIEDRLDIIAKEKHLAQKLISDNELDEEERKELAENADIVVSKKEMEYYDAYRDAIRADIAKRLGKKCFSAKLLFFSRRLCKLIELGAPPIFIKCEIHSLAQAFVLYECCESYDIVDNSVRLRIEHLESMTDEELDEIYRPQKMNSRKSMAPLFVFSILKEKSSSKKHLRQQEILNELAKHPYEIFIERKALSRIIHNLVDSSQYDIYQDKTGVWIDQE